MIIEKYSLEKASEITYLREQCLVLEREFFSNDMASGYMYDILNVLKKNPHLIDGWKYFLSVAEIDEPIWMTYD